MYEYSDLQPAIRREEMISASEFRQAPSYAMAYVPVQRWENPLCAEDALCSGTAFRSLVMPFCPKEGS